MLLDQQIKSALSVERRIYTLLLEVQDITFDLSDSLSRQDQISMQMFLNMRQDSINQLLECKAKLQSLCAELNQDDARLIQNALSGQAQVACSDISILARQAGKNQDLLRKVIHSDRVLNQRIGGSQSFYSQR